MQGATIKIINLLSTLFSSTFHYKTLNYYLYAVLHFMPREDRGCMIKKSAGER
jgi:hypothetical protein